MSSLDIERKADLVVERLTECQSALYAYVYSLTADAELSWDVLQETNRVIWNHASEYDREREFLPWARSFAFNQVRTARKKLGRDRLVFHDEATLQEISSGWEQCRRGLKAAAGEKVVALEHCISTLPQRQRDLIDGFYSNGESLDEIAKRLGRKTNSVTVNLHRIRQRLADCIRARLNKHD